MTINSKVAQPLSEELHGALDDGVAAQLALLGLLEQAPDVRAEEVELGRHVLFAAEAADVVGLSAQDVRVLTEDRERERLE